MFCNYKSICSRQIVWYEGKKGGIFFGCIYILCRCASVWQHNTSAFACTRECALLCARVRLVRMFAQYVVAWCACDMRWHVYLNRASNADMSDLNNRRACVCMCRVSSCACTNVWQMSLRVHVLMQCDICDDTFTWIGQAPLTCVTCMIWITGAGSCVAFFAHGAVMRNHACTCNILMRTHALGGK